MNESNGADERGGEQIIAEEVNRSSRCKTREFRRREVQLRHASIKARGDNNYNFVLPSSLAPLRIGAARP